MKGPDYIVFPAHALIVEEPARDPLGQAHAAWSMATPPCFETS